MKFETTNSNIAYNATIVAHRLSCCLANSGGSRSRWIGDDCERLEEPERDWEMQEPRLVSCESGGSGSERKFARKADTCERREWWFNFGSWWLR